MGVVSCGTTMLDQGEFQNLPVVTWDTTAKTAGFTAVSGNGYFVNTTSGAITVTLPATPSAGDIVSLADYANTWQNNNVTVARNGSKIGGNEGDATLNTIGQSVTFLYVDATQGWINIIDSTSNVRGLSPYIQATGGTITTSGDYKIHTFTSPGTFCVSGAGTPCGSTSVDYLVIAGGAGGYRTYFAGGGGAGGYRESHSTPVSGCYTASPLATPTAVPVSVQGYPITVGAGGSSCSRPNCGSNSVFSTIVAAGGGGGGGDSNPEGGFAGGSGGGGGGCSSPNSAGSGNTPPVSPPQGNPGGTGDPTPARSGGGGGGASAAGQPGQGNSGGAGGNGTTTSINATPTTRTGGGGGSAEFGGTGGAGGSGGGGAGGCRGSTPGVNGTVNTGSGGGAGGNEGSLGGTGGSGIVIIRYKYQ